VLYQGCFSEGINKQYFNLGIMRVLLITDSHGRGLSTKMEHYDTRLSVLNIRVVAKLSSVRGMYRRKLESIRDFLPDIMIFHLGHNDLVPHARHNPNPLFITAVVHQIQEFVIEVSTNLPDARIFVSSILPRVPANGFSINKAAGYNRLARRFGEIIRGLGNKTGSMFMGIVNRSLWGRIARSEPLAGSFHHSDGLHLNPEGKKLLVRGWLRALGLTVVSQ
jgi:lysophospholipase L1-like esterase